jgi:beta-N-acetylhexosaminidase
VLDVDSNPNNPVIGRRAFSSSAALVAELGMALAGGLAASGVAACAKHFPGHGDTELDSHLDLPRVSHSRERLEQVELVPFTAAVAAKLPSVMTAHVVFSALDPELPASMSSPIVRGLLRERLGYTGLVVSDDLEMNAIVEHHGIAEAVLRGISAGVDCFLVCHTADRMHAAIDATLRAVAQKQLDPALIDAALRRHAAFAERWVKPAPERLQPGVLRSDEHLALAATLASLSETVEER